MLIFVLGTAAAWYAMTRGGWDNVFSLAPMVDNSTPREQSGFTLMDVQRPGHYQTKYGQPFTGFQYEGIDALARDWTADTDAEDAFGMWIAPPLGSLPSSNGSLSAFSVTARLSTGDVLPLEWRECNQDGWQPQGAAGKRLIFVSLPAGYAEPCRAADIAIADQFGHSAHWIFSRLPVMRHAVPPPAALTDTVTQQGVTLTAKAWHSPPSLPNGLITFLLQPTLPPHSHQWDILTTEQSHEWEAYGDTGKPHIWATSGIPVVGPNGSQAAGYRRWFGGVVGLAGQDFYPRTTHFLRLGCELRQFETYDETVTFHNLAVQRNPNYPIPDETHFLALTKPVTQTTPSGVAVTLPAQNYSSGGMADAGCLNFLVSAQPPIFAEPATALLPASPLVRAYGKPVQISIGYGSSYLPVGMGYLNNHLLSLSVRPSLVAGTGTLPPVLKTLTLTIRQRVDIQAIPMTFTLPIAVAGPAGKSFRQGPVRP